MNIERGTTNDEAPFQPGERIVYGGKVLEVLVNDGNGYGTVRYPEGEIEDGFRWNGRENVRRYLPPPTAQEAAKRLADQVARLPSPEARLEALALMREQFCPYCGEDQPLHGACQCWNDE